MTESQRLPGQTNANTSKESLCLDSPRSPSLLAGLSILACCTWPQSAATRDAPVNLNKCNCCKVTFTDGGARAPQAGPAQAVFPPSRFGNEQLPVLFAAVPVICDTPWF